MISTADRGVRVMGPVHLVLRRQFAQFKERGVKPRRADAATRVSLALLTRLCDWRLIVVRPETVVCWRRAGWRLLWRYRSRPGRAPIPLELRPLIRRLAAESALWGEERIANELPLKPDLRVSPRSVLKSPPYSLMANAICERVIGTVRRECLDW